LNYIHNQGQNLCVKFRNDGFFRNEGGWHWEINLAAFLTGLEHE